jgi:hypothetical protein
MRHRLGSIVSLAALLIAAPCFAQIPEAPGNAGSPRDEHPGHSAGGLNPAVVPTEPEASPPEIVDLMKRSRANAEATKSSGKAKRSPEPKRKATPPA